MGLFYVYLLHHKYVGLAKQEKVRQIAGNARLRP